MVNKERLVETFLELAKTDSPSFDECLVRDVIIKHLKEIGITYYEDKAGDRINGRCGNIICKLKGEESISPILLSAHMDTVDPCINKKPIRQGDIIKTNGKTILGGDDHSGVAIILETLRVLKEEGIKHGDITAVFTVAEERGLLGAKNINVAKFNAKYGFVLDDAGEIGTYAYMAPSQISINIKIHGKASHAGVEPEKGIDAVQIFSRAVSNMNLGRIDEQTTANIGIVNGGTATNVVCEFLEAKGEARSLSQESLEQQTLHMEECFKEASKHFGGRVEFITNKEYDGYYHEENEYICKTLECAGEKTGITINRVKSGGGSDTNIFNSKNIPSVNLSAGMKNVHTVDEILDINDMLKGCEFLKSIISTIE